MTNAASGTTTISTNSCEPGACSPVCVEFVPAVNTSVLARAKALVVSSSVLSSSVVLYPECSNSSSVPEHEQDGE